MIDVDVVPYGRPASEALVERIAEAKKPSPFGAVTVIVPSNFAGLVARRLLGSGQLGTASHGIVNVNFVTPLRLAEMLTPQPSVATTERRRLTNPVLGAAVRLALADDPGPFREVRDHHATEVALAGLYGELSHVPQASLDVLRSTGHKARSAVVLHEAIAAHLHDFDNEDVSASAVVDRHDLVEACGALGHIVWFLPQPVVPAVEQMIAAVLRSAVGASVVVGSTGDAEADARVFDLCRRVGLDRGPGVGVGRQLGHEGEVPVASRIISVSDADEEVRAVVRTVVELAQHGVALDRVGVFYPTPRPYVRALRQQFANAGVPANGPSADRLLDCVAGRTLLAALSLPDTRWRRDRVMALVSDAPVLHGDSRARPATWEAISRSAGVVHDLRDWQRKLAFHGESLERRRGGPDAPSSARAERLMAEQRDTKALAEFVAALATSVEAVGTAVGWHAKSEAATDLLHHLVGTEARRAAWPEREIESAQRVESALVRLGELDELEPRPDRSVFRRALVAELDVTRGRTARFGHGVVYGPLAGAVGHDLDAVFVLGMSEGQCPAVPGDDPLLSDAARSSVPDGALPPRSARLAQQHLTFLAALAAAPADRRFLLHARGDLRSGRHHRPSRWLLDSATALAGHVVYSRDFAAQVSPIVEVVASHASAIAGAPVAASIAERDLALLLRHVDGGGRASDHPMVTSDIGTQRGFECVAARWSPMLTEWDGNLAGSEVPSPARTGEVLSATRLERWASCGFKYFLNDVLDLRDRDDPERIIELSALDRGKTVHAILQAFVGAAIERGVPEPDEAWSAADRDELGQIAREKFVELERQGVTGRGVYWRLEQERTLDVLRTWLVADEELRRSQRSRPAEVEMPFGIDGAEPAVIDLGDGRRLSFRGYVDRVDTTASGRPLVIDYKTGKRDKYATIEGADPFVEGTALQLGLYSEAVTRSESVARPSASYWMFDDPSGDPLVGYSWDEPRRSAFVEVVTAIVDGIEGGVFAAEPGEFDTFRGTHSNCRYCDFDQVCPRDRGDQHAVKMAAPELRVRERLITNLSGEPS